MTGRSIRFGDLDVPVLERAWSEAQGISGFRLIHAMKAGDSWFDVEWDDRFYEALAEVDDIVVPVGVAIASELVSTGADWAYLTEIWRGGLVLLDRDARCVEISGAVARLLIL